MSLQIFKSSILVIKSHIAELCEQQIVLTAHRNLLDVAASAYHLRWVEDLSSMFHLLDSSIISHECWKLAGAVDIQFELYAGNIEAYALNLLLIVARSFGSVSNFTIQSNALTSYVSKYAGVDANPWMPSTQGIHQKQLPAQWIGSLCHRYMTWFEKYNYSC